MLKKIKSKLTILLLVSSIIEVVFFFSWITIWGTFILLFGWFILKNFILTRRNMIYYPVTFMMFFGLAIFHFVLPIPLTLLELKPVTYNLLVPFETFLHHGLFVLILVITHFIYKGLVRKKNPLRSVLKSTIFYKNPTENQIWISAIISLVFSYYFYSIYGGWENYETKNLFITIGKAFSIFLWMPVIIPFFKIRNRDKKLTKKSKLLIIVYSLLVILISIISNWRTILYSGVVIFILLYFIGLLYGYYNYKKLLSAKSLFFLIISFYIVSGPIMDLGLAMVVTRQTRYTTSSSDFMRYTIEVFNDKEFLKKIKKTILRKDKLSFSIKEWDEDYINNYVFNRFCNLKISDNSIYYANKIGYANSKMQDVLLDKTLSFIPLFIANKLGVKSNIRGEKYQSSITDNLYSLAIGDESVKGSAIIGSMPGVGLSLFSYWYLVIIIPIFILIFIMFDSFAVIVLKRVHFSYYFFTLIFTVFNFFNDRHVFEFELRWILRNYVESIIMFLIIFSFIRSIDNLFLKKNK